MSTYSCERDRDRVSVTCLDRGGRTSITELAVVVGSVEVVDKTTAHIIT